MAVSAAAFLDAPDITAESFLDAPDDVAPQPESAAAFLDAPDIPAGEDKSITGGAQIRATPTIIDQLRKGEFGGSNAR